VAGNGQVASTQAHQLLQHHPMWTPQGSDDDRFAAEVRRSHRTTLGELMRSGNDDILCDRPQGSGDEIRGRSFGRNDAEMSLRLSNGLDRLGAGH
jgi:hypothetical protein